MYEQYEEEWNDGRWRYARFKRAYWDQNIPKSLKPVIEYLEKEHGITIENIYVAHSKAPEIEICMSAALPLDELKKKFPEDDDLGYGVTREVHSLKTFTSIHGKKSWE